MKAIVFADRLGHELAPLNERNCVALLPIASKPMINYAFESLLAAGVREVILVMSPFASLMRRNMGNGERWGISLQYVTSQGEELPSEILARQGDLLDEEQYLIVRGDMVYSVDLKDFLDQAEHQEATCIAATVSDGFTGVAIVRKQTSHAKPWIAADVLAWQPEQWQAKAAQVQQIELTGHYALLDSLHNYHHANLTAVEGKFEHLVLSGTEVHEGLRIGHRSNIVPHNRGLIGMFCRVHPTARLSGGVVVSNEVIIDKEAHLRGTLVMPNTYVGQGMEVQNAIVAGNTLITFDIQNNQAQIQYIDDFLLADLHRESLGILFANWFNRGLGSLIFLLSLPLWLIAAVMAAINQPKHWLNSVTLLSNRRVMDKDGILVPVPFEAWEWQVNSPILRHLPKLLAVMQGHLRMVGVSPQTEQAQVTEPLEPWQSLREQAPMGLLGPNQLTPCTDTDDCSSIEQAVEEACYAASRNFYRDLLWLGRGLKALFQVRMWHTGRSV